MKYFVGGDFGRFGSIWTFIGRCYAKFDLFWRGTPIWLKICQKHKGGYNLFKMSISPL
jgi:hypothetical protein